MGRSKVIRTNSLAKTFLSLIIMLFYKNADIQNLENAYMILTGSSGEPHARPPLFSPPPQSHIRAKNPLFERRLGGECRVLGEPPLFTRLILGL